MSVATVESGGGSKPLPVVGGEDADGAGSVEPILSSIDDQHWPASFRVIRRDSNKLMHFAHFGNPVPCASMREVFLTSMRPPGLPLSGVERPTQSVRKELVRAAADHPQRSLRSP